MPSHRARKAIALSVDHMEQRDLLTGIFTGPLPMALVENSAVIQLADPSKSATIRQALEKSGGYIGGNYGTAGLGVVFDSGAQRDLLTQSWQKSGLIASFATDERIHASALPVTDPMAPQQWAIAGTATASVGADVAWSRTVGAGVTVAVIDSGIDFRHPELAGQLWKNPGEIAGNGRDDDRDGYVDNTYGVNFLNNTGNAYDDAGHGSHVSGIIVAAANNGAGGVGLAPGAKIMALKVLDAYGNGSLNAAVKAIYYAVDHGARVINASWTMSIGSPALQSAIAYAASKNVVFVTAAGNEGVNNDQIPSYPGNYRLNNVLTVTAVDSSGKLASFSNRGGSTVDIAAPGVGILSTTGGAYNTWDGTSMASPYVAATAALVAALRPDFSAAQIVNQIKSTAHVTTELAGQVGSGGYLDAAAATNLAPYVAPVTTPVIPKAPIVRTPVARRQPVVRRVLPRKLILPRAQAQSLSETVTAIAD
ncbi:MAG: S8 family peptidase [Isosphaeraceae bacterium]